MSSEKKEFILGVCTTLFLLLLSVFLILSLQDLNKTRMNFTKSLNQFKDIKLKDIEVINPMEEMYFSSKKYCLIGKTNNYHAIFKNSGQVFFRIIPPVKNNDIDPLNGTWKVLNNKMVFEIKFSDNVVRIIKSSKFKIDKTGLIQSFFLDDSEVTLRLCK